MRAVPSLDIDFQRRPQAPSARLPWLVLLAGALMLGAAWSASTSMDEALTAARARVDDARRTAGGARDARPTEGDASHARAQQRLAARLGAPWSTLLPAVEAAASPDIALLELAAVAESGAVRLSGEARDFASLMAYVRRLEASAALAQVRLTGHETRREDPQRPVRFSLSAAWQAAQ